MKPGQQKTPHSKKHEAELTEFIFSWWRGDAHSHSGCSVHGAANSVEEILDHYEHLGLEFVCFAEHVSPPDAPQQQPAENPAVHNLLEQTKEISRLNRDRKRVIIALSGLEVSIVYDEGGEPILELPDPVLAQFDLVIASRHGLPREKEKDVEEIRKTLSMAIRNPNIDVIGHPDRYTRLDGEHPQEYWERYWDIWPEILREMVERDTAFEINLNSQPAPELIRLVAAAGVKLFVNYDVHEVCMVEENANVTKAVAKFFAPGRNMESMEILAQYLHQLEALGVTPLGVVNSSRKNILTFLATRNTELTKNLQQLVGRK